MAAVGNTVDGKLHTGEDLFQLLLQTAGGKKGFSACQAGQGSLAVGYVAREGLFILRIFFSGNEMHMGEGLQDQCPDVPVVGGEAQVCIAAAAETGIPDNRSDKDIRPATVPLKIFLAFIKILPCNCSIDSVLKCFFDYRINAQRRFADFKTGKFPMLLFQCVLYFYIKHLAQMLNAGIPFKFRKLV